MPGPQLPYLPGDIEPAEINILGQQWVNQYMGQALGPSYATAYGQQAAPPAPPPWMPPAYQPAAEPEPETPPETHGRDFWKLIGDYSSSTGQLGPWMQSAQLRGYQAPARWWVPNIEEYPNG